MGTSRSVEDCHALRQLGTNLLGAITEYTLRGKMNLAQETSLQSSILKLTRDIGNLVAQPQEQWLSHSIQSNETAAIELFNEWHVFQHIPLEQPISYMELGEHVEVDVPLLRRIARMLVATGVLTEAGPDRVAHTARSAIFLPGN
ncbi:O-methyltransferase, partial [Colletotrichum costaricense]